MFLWFSARQRQLWGGMRYGFPNTRGTFYDERKLLSTRPKLSGQGKGLNLAPTKKLGLRREAFRSSSCVSPSIFY
jgi:hypothetical protein